MDYYTNEQFHEILVAKRKGVNLEKIMNVNLSAEQMREIRLGEIAGVDTALYANKDLSADKMRMTRKSLIKGVPITEEELQNYNEAQLNEIRLGKKFGLETAEYTSPLFSAKQMKSMRLVLLANKLIEYIKHRSVFLMHRLEDSVSTTHAPIQPSVQTPKTDVVEPIKATIDEKAERVQSVIINTLETMDLSKFENMESLSKAVGELLSDDKVLETFAEKTEPVTAKGTFEILKTVSIDDESFAVVRNVDTNQFFTVDHYNDVDEASATWNIEKAFSCYEDANKSLSEKIMETREVSEVEANIVVEENPVSHEAPEVEKQEAEEPSIVITEGTSAHDLLKYSTSKNVEDRMKVAAHANTSPSVLEALSRNTSCRDVALAAIHNKNFPTETLKTMCICYVPSSEFYQQALHILNERGEHHFVKLHDKTNVIGQKEVEAAIVITEETSVHDLLKYSTSKNVEDRVKVAAHANTSPSVLTRLTSDPSQEVAVLAIQNKNTPTGTLKGIIANDKVAVILKVLAQASLESRDNKSTKVLIDKTCVGDEIKSKSKDIGMVTIVKLPSNEQVGDKATFIVPSFAIEDTEKGTMLSLVENRNYELRINAKESVMIKGKSLSSYFDAGKQKSLSLNERIDKATQKQASQNKETKEEKNVAKENKKSEKTLER